MNKLIGKKIKSDELPQRSNEWLHANYYKEFFITKVDQISETFNNTYDTFNMFFPDFLLRKFVSFRKVSANEIFEILSDINKSSYQRESFDLKIIEFSQIKH